jgi:hypothetical protein
MEAATGEFRFFLPAMVTALLGTPEYIRASLAHSPGNPAKAVARKLERQAVLYDSSKRFTFLLTESAIRWPLCPPALMAMQVDRLTSVARLANVRLGVIPVAESPARGPMNTFTVYDDRLVTAEIFGGVVLMRDPRDVAFHLNLFELYEEAAVFGAEAGAVLATWAEDFRRMSS